jgi:hypothetical protein
VGHILVGHLPNTRTWRQVVQALSGDADLSDVAKSVIKASASSFKRLGGDPGLNLVYWNLLNLVGSAREHDLRTALKGIGVEVSENPSVFEILSKFNNRIADELRREGRLTDAGEMALACATETLGSVILEKSSSLFGRTTDDIRRAFAELARPEEFARFSREFFTRLTQRYLAYFLSRELANHVGLGKRFEDILELEEFNHDLRGYCHGLTWVIAEYSAGWMGKSYQEGLSEERVAGYLSFGLEKLRRGLMLENDEGE